MPATPHPPACPRTRRRCAPPCSAAPPRQSAWGAAGRTPGTPTPRSPGQSRWTWPARVVAGQGGWHWGLGLGNARLVCRLGPPCKGTRHKGQRQHEAAQPALPPAGTCRLFSACRMSPSAVNTTASRPSGVCATPSACNNVASAWKPGSNLCRLIGASWHPQRLLRRVVATKQCIAWQAGWAGRLALHAAAHLADVQQAGQQLLVAQLGVPGGWAGGEQGVGGGEESMVVVMRGRCAAQLPIAACWGHAGPMEAWAADTTVAMRSCSTCRRRAPAPLTARWRSATGWAR